MESVGEMDTLPEPHPAKEAMKLKALAQQDLEELYAQPAVSPKLGKPLEQRQYMSSLGPLLHCTNPL
jgi:hypothetical protein